MVDSHALPLPRHLAHILLHEEITLTFHLKGLRIINQLTNFLQSRLLDLNRVHIENEGHSKSEIAVGNVIIVQCLFGRAQLYGKFLAYRDMAVQDPIIKGIRKVSVFSFKEDRKDQVALLPTVDDMYLNIINLPIDYILADMVEMEPGCHEVLSDSIFGEMKGGESKGRRDVGVGGVVRALGILSILEGDLYVESGITRRQFLSLV